jgi:DNA invertase Pin-like site-specific DNA recombinase
MYLRVSTDDKGQTVENQRLPLREFCTAQGWTEAAEYADEASATDLRGRLQWRRLLDDCAKRKVDLVLVWRIDRAFRSVLDAAQTLERLRAWGVGLRSYQEPWLDTTSPFGEALYYITVAYAQLERGILRERVKAGMERAKREGRRVGRPPVTARPGFAERWAEVEPEIRTGPPLQEPGGTPVGRRLRHRPATAANGEGRGSLVSRRRASGPALRVT